MAFDPPRGKLLRYCVTVSRFPREGPNVNTARVDVDDAVIPRRAPRVGGKAKGHLTKGEGTATILKAQTSYRASKAEAPVGVAIPSATLRLDRIEGTDLVEKPG